MRALPATPSVPCSRARCSSKGSLVAACRVRQPAAEPSTVLNNTHTQQCYFAISQLAYPRPSTLILLPYSACRTTFRTQRVLARGPARSLGSSHHTGRANLPHLQHAAPRAPATITKERRVCAARHLASEPALWRCPWGSTMCNRPRVRAVCCPPLHHFAHVFQTQTRPRPAPRPTVPFHIHSVLDMPSLQRTTSALLTRLYLNLPQFHSIQTHIHSTDSFFF